MSKHIDIQRFSEDTLVPQPDFEITLQGYTQYPEQCRSLITHKTDAVTLDELLPVMEDFLRGLGFHFTGRLNIIDEEA